MKINYLVLALMLAVVCLGQRPRSRSANQGCSLGPGGGDISPSDVSNTTGNPALDTAFVKERLVLNKAFGVNPSLFILNDSNGSNAFAIPESLQPGFQGSVLFGYRLMIEEFTSSPTNFTIPAIMAHEFGHIYQFTHGGGPRTTKLMELHADYLAGWYMRNRQSGSPWSQQSLRQTLYAFYSKGDYAFNDPSHHGTPDERLKAALAGINDSSPGAAGAYQSGLRMVAQFEDGSDSSQDDTDSKVSHRKINQTASSSDSSQESPATGLVLDESTEQVIRRLIAERPGHFASLRGPLYFPDKKNLWTASLTIPGSSSCTVHKLDDLSIYQCNFHLPSSDVMLSEYYRFVKFLQDRFKEIGCDKKKSSTSDHRTAECDEGIEITARGGHHKDGSEYYNITFSIDDDDDN